jgi:hypothetical protein
MKFSAGQRRSARLAPGWDRPLVHHYSWVRTREQMLRKVRAWGHNRDRDWEKLVAEHFARPESERIGPRFRDFIHGYSYETVTPYIALT